MPLIDLIKLLEPLEHLQAYTRAKCLSIGPTFRTVSLLTQKRCVAREEGLISLLKTDFLMKLHWILA